jgi:hypothetical protein
MKLHEIDVGLMFIFVQFCLRPKMFNRTTTVAHRVQDFFEDPKFLHHFF